MGCPHHMHAAYILLQMILRSVIKDSVRITTSFNGFQEILHGASIKISVATHAGRKSSRVGYDKTCRYFEGSLKVRVPKYSMVILYIICIITFCLHYYFQVALGPLFWVSFLKELLQMGPREKLIDNIRSVISH